MVEIRPFQPPDLCLLEPKPEHLTVLNACGPWRAQGLRIPADGPAWTGLLAGRVLGCAGLSRVWHGRAVAWCILARDIPATAWLGIHRAVRRILGQAQPFPFSRVEAQTAAGWPPGERWLAMLGFEREGIARAFGPDGSDYSLWARVRRG